MHPDTVTNNTHQKNTRASGPLKVAFAGGGSGGPVAPFFAMAEALRAYADDAQFLLIGTAKGPEREMAAWNHMRFEHIQAGKLRRYLSIKTLYAPIQSAIGFFQARKLLKKFRPNVFVGAGGYVSVPAGYAAWSLGIPILIHQQDFVPSISNRLLAPIAKRVTVSFEKSVQDFRTASGMGIDKMHEPERCIWTGNPVRSVFSDISAKAISDESYNRQLREKFSITGTWPILLVFGGGTGAAGLNRIVHEALPILLQRFEIIHVTGSGKGFTYDHQRYHQYSFMEDMPEAYAIADVVISRAGVGTITELAAARKAAIVIPMPDSHQEDNALFLHEHHAALVYAEPLLDAERLANIATKLLYDIEMQQLLREQIARVLPDHASEKVAEQILTLARHEA